jgi:hypothetical protein
MTGGAQLALWSSAIVTLAERMGRAGVLGIGLLVFALTWQVSAVVPASDELALLQSRLARAERSAAQGVAPERGAAGQLKAFYGHFPKVSEAPGLVLKIHTVAQAQGLVLETGEYHMTRDAGLGMVRYQISLPLKGAYPQVRRFIANVLDEVPAAVLDEVAIKRDAVGARGVETRVRLTLFLAERP